MDIEKSKDPIQHIHNMKNQFKQIIEYLRSDIEIIEEPRCRAIFETAAEVLTGLIKAFEDYENKSESAWK